MDYLLLLCFCLLKQETTLVANLTTDSFNEFLLEKSIYEEICVQKLLSNSTVPNFSKMKFDKCINGSLDNRKQLTAIRTPTEFLDKALGDNSNQENDTFELNKLTIFLIAIYSITVLISLLGNALLIIVMFCGYRSSLLDISIFLLNLGIFNLLM